MLAVDHECRRILKLDKDNTNEQTVVQRRA
jgi:hypothetical protein